MHRPDHPYRPLPAEALALCAHLEIAPRLTAHLTLVHDTAWRLTEVLLQQFPGFCFDRGAVLFGAATHDIGKVAVPAELSGPGHLHEQAGFDLLCAHGVDPRLARFARDHAAWCPESPAELLLVSLSDTLWKGKRIPRLEEALLLRLVSCGAEHWPTLVALDNALEALALDADTRLAWHAAHPL